MNQFTPLAYVPPPCTKCQRIRSDMTNAAPMATIPYTAPLPGVRLPKNSVSSAEITGRRTTIHEDVMIPEAAEVASATT